MQREESVGDLAFRGALIVASVLRAITLIVFRSGVVADLVSFVANASDADWRSDPAKRIRRGSAGASLLGQMACANRLNTPAAAESDVLRTLANVLCERDETRWADRRAHFHLSPVPPSRR
jgi:hypothetical protein